MNEKEYSAAVRTALQAGDPFVLGCALEGSLSSTSTILFVTLLEAGHPLSLYEGTYDREVWEGEAGLALLRRFLHSLRHNSTLRFLELYRCLNGHEDEFLSEMAEVLPCNATLLSLQLEDNRLGHSSPTLLARSLLQAGSLQQLYLDRNSIGAEGGRELARVLRYNTTLRVLSLGHNAIGEGGEDLARMLMDNRSLRSVELEHNDMPPETMTVFENVLVQNKTLRELVIYPGNHVDFTISFLILTGLRQNHTVQLFPWKADAEGVFSVFLQRNRQKFLQLHSLRMAASAFIAARPSFLDTPGKDIPELCTESVDVARRCLEGDRDAYRVLGLWECVLLNK